MSLKRSISLIFGVVFLLVGVIGFFSNPILGFIGIQWFVVNLAHNLVHILSGILGLIGSKSDKYANYYLKGFGLVYALVAVLGLVWPNDMILGFIHIDFTDDILHIVLADGLLISGFALPDHKEVKAM